MFTNLLRSFGYGAGLALVANLGGSLRDLFGGHVTRQAAEGDPVVLHRQPLGAVLEAVGGRVAKLMRRIRFEPEYESGIYGDAALPEAVESAACVDAAFSQFRYGRRFARFFVLVGVGVVVVVEQCPELVVRERGEVVDVNDVRWEVFGCGVGHKISS